MKIYCLNDTIKYIADQLADSTSLWIVYNYTRGSYEGCGEAIVKDLDGSYAFHSLGHCSCYGPGEGGRHVYKLTFQGMLEELGYIAGHECEVVRKICELDELPYPPNNGWK